MPSPTSSPGQGWWQHWIRFRERSARTGFPPGHFYSPVVDPDFVQSREAAVWPAQPAVAGIDFNEASHAEILERVFPRFISDYRYPETVAHPDDTDDFFTRNSQFSWLDSRALFVLLRHWRPRRVIEVGSGFSSLLIADVNRRFLDSAVHVTCIEPYPRPFLRRMPSGIGELVVDIVQDVPVATFSQLDSNDVLFIDSSHVAKTGSDVNYLCFEVLPRLKPGVHIHFHDIFLPNDYPRDWVLHENRSWNEQYLVRALLMYSTAFRVAFGSSFAFHRFPSLVAKALDLPSGAAFGGGSMWIDKIA